MAKGRKVRASRAARSEERFSRNAETDLVCRLLLEKKKEKNKEKQNVSSTKIVTRNPCTRYVHLARIIAIDTAIVLRSVFLFFFYFYGTHRDLHSFPTRRSSDLNVPSILSHFSSSNASVFDRIVS